MPSGRDSFRRNRVAPFVPFYFTTLRATGCWRSALSVSLKHRNPYRRILEVSNERAEQPQVCPHLRLSK
jgi:hypothetical protein